MEIKVKNINAYTREIEINVSWEECRDDFQLTVKKFGKKVRIPAVSYTHLTLPTKA